MVTIFPAVVCPLCNNKVVSLSDNKLFECCGTTFLAGSERGGVIIKEVSVIRQKCCKRKVHVIIKKVF
jgi:hypothetical protein